MLGYLAFLRHRNGFGPGRWYSTAADNTARPNGSPWGAMSGPTGNSSMGGWSGWGCKSRNRSAAPPSGNRAFDEYRAETLRRLEEEQREFVEYLERLRQARDKAEFDSFMADRRNRQAPQAPTDQV